MARTLWTKALGALDGIANAHSTSPVPLDQSVSAFRISLVMLGIAFTLTGLYTGSELAASLGLPTGIRASVLGGIVLTAMSVPAAIVGARTRLSTYMIVSHVFGKGGAKVVNLVLAIVLLGWYAVTAELFGRTFFLTASPYLSANIPVWVYTVASSTIVIATTVFGFRAINRLSLMAAPLLVALTAYVAWRALAHLSWSAIAAIPGTHVDLATGVSAVIGGWIVNVVLMPDVTRYSRSTLECAVISFVGNGLGAAGALILSMLPALAFGEIDPMKYMAILGMVGVAFAVLVVSTWTINAVNLYSTGLVTSTAFRRVSYGRLVVTSGIVGTIFAVIGVADRLIDFLVILGLVVPPIAAVYLTDFFVLGRRNYADAGNLDTSLTNLNGLGGCFAGAALGLAMYYTHSSLTGVPTIESFLSAALVYAAAEYVRGSCARDRHWRRLALKTDW
jgi:cytosine permease